MDLFLKFDSEEQAIPFLYDIVTEYRDENNLPFEPTTNIDGTINVPEGATQVEVKKPKFVNIDVIGDIYKPTGATEEVTGPSGNVFEVPTMEKLPGYHVNVRVVNEDATDLLQFSIQPSNPVRVWA